LQYLGGVLRRIWKIQQTKTFSFISNKSVYTFRGPVASEVYNNIKVKKVNVNFTLVQAVKAQEGSRSIALLFL
jgi:hypothetical protein